MNRIYYSQNDNRWAKHPYTSKKYPSATIKSGGCRTNICSNDSV